MTKYNWEMGAVQIEKKKNQNRVIQFISRLWNSI